MKVYVSEVGHYGIHYRTEATIRLPTGTNLRVWQEGTRINRSRGYVPMLLPASVVQTHNLPSAVVWSRA